MQQTWPKWRTILANIAGNVRRLKESFRRVCILSLLLFYCKTDLPGGSRDGGCDEPVCWEARDLLWHPAVENRRRRPSPAWRLLRRTGWSLWRFRRQWCPPPTNPNDCSRWKTEHQVSPWRPTSKKTFWWVSPLMWLFVDIKLDKIFEVAHAFSQQD